MNENKSDFNWLACLGVGCMGILLISAVVAYYAVNKGAEVAREITAGTIKAAARKSMEGFSFTKEEIDDAMVPINAFAKKISDGEIDFEQGILVATEFAEGPLPAIFMVRAFRTKYLDPSGLTEEEKKDASMTLDRFGRGVSEDKIGDAKSEAILDMISTKTTDANGNTHRTFKETLSDEELRKALAQMKTDANGAGIANEPFTVNIRAEIQNAIDRGMKAAAEGKK